MFWNGISSFSYWKFRCVILANAFKSESLVARSIISLAAVAQGGSHMGMREGAALHYLACQHISEYQQ